MHAHHGRRAEGVRSGVLALLIPALLALGASAARAQSYLVSTPSLTGGWAANYSAAAEGGTYYATFNAQDAPTAAAVWSVSLPQSGQYQVYVSSVPAVDVPRTANARYEVSTVLGPQLVSGVDQNFSGEQLLGTFSMGAGINVVRLTDLTGEPAGSRTVVANAARWVLVTSGPPPSSGTPAITGYLDNYGHAINSLPPGTPLQIIGGNFGLTAGQVKIAGINAPLVRWSPTDIRVLTPLGIGSPTTGPVTVTFGGQTITGPDFTIDPNAASPQPAPPGPGPVQPPPAPVVNGYAATNPRGVPIFSAPPGAPVLIEGSNLGATGSVTFNGVPAVAVSWSPTELLVTVPSAPFYPFSGPVTVTANGQTAYGPNFTITAPSTPPPPSADWPMFMHDARQTGLADSALDPRSLSPWSLNLGSRPGISPVIVGGTAYIGTDAGLFAINVSTRQVRWARALAAPVRSAPAVTAQVVVVAAGGLYGLNPADGSVLWQRPDIVADTGVSPMILNGTVYIGTGSASGAGPAMFAVSAATGQPVWPAPVALPSGFEARGTAAASENTGLLYVGLGPPEAAVGPAVGPSAVLALRLADGSTAWSMPASAPPVGISIGYAGSGAQPGPGGVLPALVQAAVFIATGQNVTAFSAYNGAVIWSRTLPAETALQGPPVLSTAASGPSTLYVGGTSGQLYALNSLTGSDAAVPLAAQAAPVAGTLALAGSTLYVPTATGLAAVDVTTGALIWNSPLAAGSGVAVAGGTPYVATSDGLFVGFATGLFTGV